MRDAIFKMVPHGSNGFSSEIVAVKTRGQGQAGDGIEVLVNDSNGIQVV